MFSLDWQLTVTVMVGPVKMVAAFAVVGIAKLWRENLVDILCADVCTGNIVVKVLLFWLVSNQDKESYECQKFLCLYP